MLHHKAFVAVFYTLCNNLALHISSIYKIILIIPISTGDLRFSQESRNMHRAFLPIHLNQTHGHISSIDMIDYILEASISGSLDPHLSTDQYFECHLWMRQCQMSHQLMDC